MKCSNGLAQGENLDRLIKESCRQAMRGWEDESIDLGFVVASSHFRDEFPRLAQSIKEKTQVEQLVGCSAEGVIGQDRELEREPALSLWLSSFENPGVETHHFRFHRKREEFIGLPLQSRASSLFLFGDPFSFPAHLFLEEIKKENPHLMVMGGMVSGISQPSQCQMILNDEILHSGAVAFSLPKEIGLTPVVSQGCRPVGDYLVVTKAEDNIIYELGGKPAVQKLQETLLSLEGKEKRLVLQGLHVGIAIDASQSYFGRGDFLVRNVVGVHQGREALLVTDFVKPGQTIQFHVRDAQTASQDFQYLLSRASKKSSYQGGLLFTCNGRGKRMFSQGNHDVQLIRENLGPLPIGGFFAAGEIGPVRGKNFLHAFTASLALFNE